MSTPFLYTHTIICKIPQSRSEFQAHIQPQRPAMFSNASQRRAPIGGWVKKKKQTLNIPLSNYALDGVTIHPVTTKTQASLLTQLPERQESAKGFHHDANGEFKTVRVKWL